MAGITQAQALRIEVTPSLEIVFQSNTRVQLSDAEWRHPDASVRSSRLALHAVVPQQHSPLPFLLFSLSPYRNDCLKYAVLTELELFVATTRRNRICSSIETQVRTIKYLDLSVRCY
ncbi:unnamed protein product [Hydatigera taeniaeformis]|uniref:Uncharacterized protein n=1 Tax=Hydatigena taeniaeformis TaxID=6205 RepID=A0A0R3XAC6_HYDTA|nr:unnamed protein product [Hydatigera taeniaeformis]